MKSRSNVNFVNCGQCFQNNTDISLIHKESIHLNVKSFKCNANNCNKCFRHFI